MLTPRDAMQASTQCAAKPGVKNVYNAGKPEVFHLPGVSTVCAVARGSQVSEGTHLKVVMVIETVFTEAPDMRERACRC